MTFEPWNFVLRLMCHALYDYNASHAVRYHECKHSAHVCMLNFELPAVPVVSYQMYMTKQNGATIIHQVIWFPPHSW